MVFGTRGLCTSSHQHPWQPVSVLKSVKNSARTPCQVWRKLPRDSISRATHKGDADAPTDNRILNGGKETLLQGNAVDKQKPTTAAARSDESEVSASEATQRKAAADSSSVKSSTSSEGTRPDAKQAAKHLITFNKVAERANARSRVRNGAKKGSNAAPFGELDEDMEDSGGPRRSLSSSSLADVVLSASSNARVAASKDIPDARTPQKLLSTLKNKKKPKSLRNSKISGLSSFESSANVSTSPAKQLKSPALSRLQKRLEAGRPNATGVDTASVGKSGTTPSSRWGQVSGVIATGGSKELAAAEGGATFVHKARERFMDVDGKTFWELIRSVVPQQEWTQTAKALARLQSISRVELSQQADFAATALELANSATVLPPQDTVDTKDSAFSSADLGDGSGATAPSKSGNSSSESDSNSGSESGSETSSKSQSPKSLNSKSKQSAGPGSTVDLNTRAYVATEGAKDSIMSTVDLEDEFGPSLEALVASMGPGVAMGAMSSPPFTQSKRSSLTGSQYLTGSVQNTSIDSLPSSPSSNSALRGASKGGSGSPSTGGDEWRQSRGGNPPYQAPVGGPNSPPAAGAGAAAWRGDTQSRGKAGEVEFLPPTQSVTNRDAAPAPGMRVGPGVVAAGAAGAAGASPKWGSMEDADEPPGAEPQALFAHNSKLVLQLQWFALRAHSGPLTHSEAMSLDHLLTQQLLALAGSAHFGGLRPRDVALAKSLNEDKLSQLFVKVDKSTLDARLVAPHTHADLPEEARSLMVLKRGTGKETSEGLLFVQKLDYLQLLLVEAVSEAVGNAWSSIAATGGRIARAGVDAGAAAASEAVRVAEETGVQYPSEPLVDTKSWGKLKGRGKDAIVAMREWGMSPRMIGGGLLLTLSDLGLGPKVDVIRLPRFDAVWPAPDKHPVRIRRVTLEDVFKRPGVASESLLKRLIKPATLEEPTFQELLVVYRRKSTAEPQWLAKYQDARIQWLKIVDRVLDNGTRAQTAIEQRAQQQHTAAQREPVQLRVLSDIPMAYWQAVFPDKLMQFKPLDGLRLDFITVVGVVAVLAQIKVDSPVLQIVSLASLVVAVVRSVLGYQRMSIRYENFTNEMIASKTLAQEEAVIEFLARAAAQQRFASAALAYAVLVRRAHRARTNIAAVAAAEAAATVAADDAAASAARRAAEPLREQPWLARHMAQIRNDSNRTPDGDSSEEGEQSIGSSAGAALSALLDEGQKLLEAVRSVAGARGDSEGIRSGKPRKRRGSWQGPGMTASELRLEVETMLNEKGLGHVRFDVNSALHELRRLQLLQTEDDAVRRWLRDAGIALAPHPELDGPEGSGRREKGLEGSRTRAFERRYVPVSSSSAEQALTGYWTMLLEGSVETSLAGIL